MSHTAAGEGVSLTNGVIKVSFDGSGHIQGWTTADGGTHPFSHTYTQYFEKAGVLDLFTVCGGTNVYTFVPDEGSQILTPKVSGNVSVCKWAGLQCAVNIVSKAMYLWQTVQEMKLPLATYICTYCLAYVYELTVFEPA